MSTGTERLRKIIPMIKDEMPTAESQRAVNIMISKGMMQRDEHGLTYSDSAKDAIDNWVAEHLDEYYKTKLRPKDLDACYYDAIVQYLTQHLQGEDVELCGRVMWKLWQIILPALYRLYTSGKISVVTPK